MVTGRLPWGVADEERDDEYAAFAERLLTYDVEGSVFVEDPAKLGIGPNLCRLLDAMLHPDPRQRASLGKVAEYLDLPWFTAPTPVTVPMDFAPSTSVADVAVSDTTAGSLAFARTHQLLDSGVSVGPDSICGMSPPPSPTPSCSSPASCDDSGTDTMSVNSSGGRKASSCASASWQEDDEGLGDDMELPPLPSFLIMVGGA